MLFERYAFKYRENNNIQNNIFDIQISDNDFMQININNENFDIFTELLNIIFIMPLLKS